MRSKALDLLRAAAVLLVISRHSQVARYRILGGWSGVDLFFVLSGFLISGLLFTEYLKYRQIRVGRFLARRGFKIYPPFYTLIAWTSAMFLLYGHAVPPDRLLSDLFFLQSYRGGIWDHSWSLGVEEHFYVGLALLLYFLTRHARNRKDPFGALPAIFLTVALFVLGMRLYRSWPYPAIAYGRIQMTHLHIDSLLFGVLLSYFFRFRSEQFGQFCRSHRPWMALAGFTLVTPSFLWDMPDSYFVQTVGHTFLYLGYGSFVALAVTGTGTGFSSRWSLFSLLGDWLAALGKYSYSVYLWHYPMLLWGQEFLRRVHLRPANQDVRFVIYLAGSIVVGILMARIVEYPLLNLRDKLFPSRSSAVAPSRETGSDVCVTPGLSASATD